MLLKLYSTALRLVHDAVLVILLYLIFHFTPGQMLIVVTQKYLILILFRKRNPTTALHTMNVSVRNLIPENTSD